MTTADWIQIALLIVVILQLLFAIISFRKGQERQLQEFKADHERRRKEATIKHVNGIRHDYRGIRKILDKKFGEGTIINIDDIDENTKEELKEMLSLMEHLSAGVNSSVYDFDMVFIMSAGYFRGIYERCMPFIADRRRLTGREALYCEFETLSDRIKEKQAQPRNKEADIKFSSEA